MASWRRQRPGNATGEDSQAVRVALYQFGYAARMRGQSEPATLQAAIAAARKVLATKVMTLPPEGDPDFANLVDWTEPPLYARTAARQLLDAVAR